MTTLADRKAFEQYATELGDSWDALRSGETCVISVGISECSLSKGADKTLTHLRMLVEREKFKAQVRQVGCAGWCWAEPYVEVQSPGAPPIIYQKITTDKVPELFAAIQRGEAIAEWAIGVRSDKAFHGIAPLDEHPFLAKQHRLLTAQWGIIDPESIDDYIARGGYRAYIKALFDMTPDEVVAEVKTASVRGRGGAGFPAGIKWESGRRTQAWPKYVIANSHEGEPNVFKDRRLLESNPHLVLEGIMIGCLALETEHGYNYIGGEHQMALRRSRWAVKQAYEVGLLGDNVLGTGKNVHVRVRPGAGAYICGEGSALMYSVMGQRGQPRTKPPRSVEEGVWKRPTVLNNTETFANVPGIITNGGDWYAAMGTEKSNGTKLVTIQGPVKRIGVAEIDMGLSMRDMLFEIFGGMRDGYTFKGVQTGGVSSGPLKEDQLDVGVDFDSMTPLGGMLGSGGFVVFDESVSAVDFARYLVAFSRFESCAKCTPCRLGNPALVEIVDRIRHQNGKPRDLPLIRQASKPIIEMSLCGLGQVAPMPVLGMMNQYPEDFDDMISKAGPRPERAQPDRAVADD